MHRSGTIRASRDERWRATRGATKPGALTPCRTPNWTTVTALGFVTRVAVDGDAVAVDFRLPTYWCSPNFAWIMAEDMRATLTALPWPGRSRSPSPTTSSREDQRSGQQRHRFRRAFADAHGDLAALRATFGARRTLAAWRRYRRVRAAGQSDAELLAMTVGLATLAPADSLRGGRDAEGIRRRARVTAACRAISSSVPSSADRTPATTRRSARRRARTSRRTRCRSFLRGVRMARRGVEANGEMCRIYLRERSADIAADRARKRARAGYDGTQMTLLTASPALITRWTIGLTGRGTKPLSSSRPVLISGQFLQKTPSGWRRPAPPPPRRASAPHAPSAASCRRRRPPHAHRNRVPFLLAKVGHRVLLCLKCPARQTCRTRRDCSLVA